MGCKYEVLSVPNCDFPAAEGPDTVFRAFGIQHDGNRQFELVPDCLDHVNLFLVFLVSAV